MLQADMKEIGANDPNQFALAEGGGASIKKKQRERNLTKGEQLGTKMIEATDRYLVKCLLSLRKNAQLRYQLAKFRYQYAVEGE